MCKVSYLALGVSLDLPAPRQFQLGVCKLVEENHQVPVVLVAFKVPGIAAHLQNHVFHTAAAGEHPVGCLESMNKFTLIFRKVRYCTTDRKCCFDLYTMTSEISELAIEQTGLNTFPYPACCLNPKLVCSC